MEPERSDPFGHCRQGGDGSIGTGWILLAQGSRDCRRCRHQTSVYLGADSQDSRDQRVSRLWPIHDLPRHATVSRCEARDGNAAPVAPTSRGMEAKKSAEDCWGADVCRPQTAAPSVQIPEAATALIDGAVAASAGDGSRTEVFPVIFSPPICSSQVEPSASICSLTRRLQFLRL